MICLHQESRSLGKMFRSGCAEIELQLVDIEQLTKFGTWELLDDMRTFPRSELRYFLSRDSAAKALMELTND